MPGPDPTPRSGAPRFFLARTPDEGTPSLRDEEAEHARRVRRLAVGDPLIGLDGRGRAWPLEVGAVGRRELAVVATGPATSDPAPGEPGAPLPWIEVAVAWPRRGRAEEMLGRLVQLGAAAIQPLAAEQGGPERAAPADQERTARLLREACKQSRRTWLPELLPTRTPAELLTDGRRATAALLDPGAGLGLDTWLRSLIPGADGLGTREHPLRLVVGPEGGFTAAERDALLSAGVTPVRLGPHVLRIETAAEAALAVASTALRSP
jgi:16S rRNA (uracil1498-N3)-methyltransferase